MVLLCFGLTGWDFVLELRVSLVCLIVLEAVAGVD